MAVELLYMKSGFMRHLICKFLVPFFSAFIVTNSLFFLALCSWTPTVTQFFFAFISYVLIFNSCVFIYIFSFKQVSLGPVYMVYVNTGTNYRQEN